MMLDWMKDDSVVKYLQNDFKSKTKTECIEFIKSSQSNKNVHFAIADDDDMYVGTVSLKNINAEAAEFAITVCKRAMGKGYAVFAMNELLLYGFNEKRLKYIYWCVSEENKRALRFYDKNGYKRIDIEKLRIETNYTEEQRNKYVWYMINCEEALMKKGMKNANNKVYFSAAW